MRKFFGVLALAAIITLTGSAGAYAADDYPGEEPTEPTLAGSTVTGICDGDVPWIGFTVELNDPDDKSTSHTARLVITDGTNSTTIELGELVNNRLSGRVLWPGASTDDAGNPTGWPGWAFVDGAWVETDGNFAWTRGDITAELQVNPEIPVALSYPPASPYCATGPELSSDGETLPATGTDFPVVGVAAFGAVIALIGGALFLARPRRANR
ncbi:LPXTG cell wall anchor domain-containing protein [Microbacterium terricola]|uniref:Gram-positive cocci surface proteins LPxTG domain-containing protein n=1 Tax=Microbacterium terricola TaxID=344163 RepID=A0ABM8DYI6_9MICO|nr:LPXTG cell wall anchor domain-containing protein [Microbacterium terricola]UYK38639.1 LPXTG cell wall anchor domain-containing protein [Microbacterium terricola]BDV30674.1 hypothetical protein Microterr_13340 [Microbacterium terricola]